MTTASVRTGRRRDGIAERQPQLSLEQALSLPIVPAGPLDDLVARLWAQRERAGFSYLTVPEPRMEAFAPVTARLRESRGSPNSGNRRAGRGVRDPMLP